MEVYGYLELAFKVGRSVTIGGFGGVFKDRTWDQVDNELEASQRERLRAFPGSCPEARVQSQAPGSCPVPGGVRHLTLDVSRAGVRYGVGDRCIIFPENSPELIALTLRVLAARGDERVALTDEWREAGNVRRELAGKTELPVRDVLRFGCIRPVTPRIAEALHARTQSGLLLEQLQRCCTERWELWELIELLRDEGLNPVDLWSEAGVKVSERLCRIIPPERFRVYSIASATPSPLGKPAASIDLIVGHLRYPGASDALAALARTATGSERPSGCPVMNEAGAEVAVMREGTASSFLARAEREQASFPFRIERPARFQLPPDARTPIIFFAGGTGVSPFLGFLQERLRSSAGGRCWLFWSLRTRQDFVCDAELGPALRAGLLQLDVCFTRESAEVDVDPAGQLRVREGSARRISELMGAPEAARSLWQLLAADSCAGASVYICGRSGFARSVLDGLKSVFREFAAGSESERAAQANEILYRLVANNRLLLEIHTDAQPANDEPRWIDVSEIAAHNGDGAGYWMIIDRVVYDLTEFMELHPGGRRVVQAYAGLDATHGYARAHHQRPEVDAMREMYRIGMVRALEFDDYTTQIEGPSGPYTVSCRTAHVAWVQALHLVVEMQNALRADYSLQRCVTTAGEAAEELGRYKLSRAAETHCRFLEHYQRVLEEETLPSLWRISQGLFAPEVSADWMSQELSRIKASSLGQEMYRLAHEILHDFSAFSADLPRLQRMLGTFQAADLRLLAELKRVLASGVRVFERHQKRTRQCGSAELRSIGTALVGVLEEAASNLAASMGASQEELTPTAEPVAVCLPEVRVARRLYSSVHWIFEERSDESLSVLRRTPVAWTSLGQLSDENEAILRSLGEHQRSQGLLVDMREAPIRNDADFENAMAKLRQGLTDHFKRMAILLESNLGELQVTRIERDERRNALATRSESSALKFLLGGK
jgi:sulfite reductase (NADPH) flavoprotein alpha-component